MEGNKQLINELIILFCLTALLFFIVSALVPLKRLYIVIPLNIVFLVTLLFSYVQFIGTPLPFQDNIPWIKMQHFTAKNLVTIFSMFETDTLIHMTVQEPDGSFKAISLAKTPELEAELDKAVSDASKNHVRVKMAMTDTMYGPESGSPFPDPELQNNMHENKPPQDQGVEVHESGQDADPNKPHITN
jgi:hypothetical protein